MERSLFHSMAKKLLITGLLALQLFLGSTGTVQAATDETEHFDVFEILNVDKTDNPDATTEFSENIRNNAKENNISIPAAILIRIIDILLLLIGSFAFVTLFYAGVMFVTAGGDEGKIDKAKGMFTPAILGLVVAFLSYYIVTFVQSFFYS